VAIQEKRTPDAEARARADVDESVWRFADVMGPTFTNEALPTLSAFFDRVVATEAAVVDPAKAEWKRVRPFVASKRVRPCVAPSTSGSYPSGHTTVGTTMGIILSNMLPEKRDAIMARAWDYGWNRVVGGVHYRSDVEAGRIAGSLIFQAMAAREEFKDEFVAASAELRAVMGLAR
jgi:acid phosphatase (class A)